MTSAIEWLWPPWVDRGKTLNYILGCSHAGGPGCDHCWAETDTWTRQNNPNPKMERANAGLTVLRANGRPRWTGKINMVPERFAVPFRTRQRWGIFTPSKSDPWHESLMGADAGRRHVAAAWGMKAALPQHTWFVLTKRPHLGVEHQAWIHAQAAAAGVSPARFCMDVLADVLDSQGEYKLAARVAEAPTPAWPLPNVWVLTSVEDQQRYDERVPALLELEAAIKGLSVEPMVGPVTISAAQLSRLGWVINGGESGTGARPMHPDWARALRDQCASAGVPYFYKQEGDWTADIRNTSLLISAGEPPDDPSKAGQIVMGTIVSSTKRKSIGKRTAWHVDAGGHHHKMWSVGKGKAGHEIDGVAWNQYPPEPRCA